MSSGNNDLIHQALSYWANHIETGSMLYSAKEVQHHTACERMTGTVSPIGAKVKALDNDQMKLVIRLRELAALALNNHLAGEVK